MEVGLLLVLGVAVLSPLAERWLVPTPVVLTLYGVLLALVPGIPDALPPSEVVLPLLLPPLLYAAAQRGSWHDFTRNAAALVSLAVVLVVVTTAVVAVAVLRVDSQLTVAAAITLGAIVSPPDPVAATSLAGRLGLPKRLVDILEGEGLLNDAIALVLYAVAVSAAATGSFSVTDASRILGVSVVVAPLVGFALAWLAVQLLDRLDDPRGQVAITLVLPYAAYLAVTALDGSGVLAVVVAGLYVGQHGGGALSSSGFLAGTTVWAFADWVVSGVAFGLIGFELSVVLSSPDFPAYGALAAAVTCAAVVLVRAAYVVPLDWLVRRVPSRRGRHDWREATVVAWAGMRGVVTLATALALPQDFPGRPVVVFCAIAVVLVTLVGQGVTLPFVARRLVELGDGEDRTELVELRQRVADAALARLEDLVAEDAVPGGAEDTLRATYERMRPRDLADVPEEVRSRRHDARAVARELREVERTTVLGLRRSGETSAAAATTVLRDIEARELHAERGRPGGPIGADPA